jgi:hypothetical protein
VAVSPLQFTKNVVAEQDSKTIASILAVASRTFQLLFIFPIDVSFQVPVLGKQEDLIQGERIEMEGFVDSRQMTYFVGRKYMFMMSSRDPTQKRAC